MRSLRLLHVLPTYMPPWHDGGPVVAVHGLCQALAARGHKVTVFTTDVHGAATNGEEQGLLPFDDVEVWYFPVAGLRRLYRSPAMAERLKSELKGAGNFDLIHLHSVFLWPTYAVARAAERAKIPYVVAPRGMLVRALLRQRGWLRKWLWIWLRERRTLTRAAAIHATSNLEKRDIEDLGLRLKSRIFVVGNGVDTESLAPVQDVALAPTVRAALERRREEGQVRHLLLFLGRLSWKKGLDRLIKALAKVKDATLIIAGHDEEGFKAGLARLAAAEGVANRIVYVGPVHGADKAALLHRTDLLVLPSVSENFGNVVLEAMAAGLPVVVTPEVGLADVVHEVGAGVVAAGDPVALAAALRALLADPEGRRAMGRRGVEVATNRFDWGTVARQMEDEYLKILNDTRQGAAAS